LTFRKIAKGFALSRPSIPKSAFANVDARVRCPTEDCLGDLMLFPTGVVDEEGFPVYQPFSACPLCLEAYDIGGDLSDRELYLRIAWLRANPGAEIDERGDRIDP
jgi:hypothetical protein